LSVVLASCRSMDLVAEAIRRLLPQCRQAGAELIVARRTSKGEPGADPQAGFDGCRLVECPATATIPELRGAGLAGTTGDWVALTEDNCVVHPRWLERLGSCFGMEVDVVGGAMGNAHPARPIDGGAFFAEYGFFGPLRQAPERGGPPLVTGANVAYRRSVVGEVAAWARAGHWENVIHDRLAASGARFALVPDALVEQNLHYRLGAFCRDRFEHARDYARVRSAGLGKAKRLTMIIGTSLLPAVLTWRVWRSAGRSRVGDFLRALPFTLTFFAAWAAGEATGYLRGRAS